MIIGYEVHVATNGEETFPYCDVKHQISIERSPFRWENIKAIQQLKEITIQEKFDIIHCHTPMGSFVGRIASKKARKENKTRVIYTSHGFHFYYGASWMSWMIYYPIEWILSKYTDTIVTINKEDYEFAKNKFQKHCKDIVYMPGMGVDEKKFSQVMTLEEKKNLKKQLHLSENDFIMIYPARLDKNKNQFFLIQVMSELAMIHPNIHLLLPGNDELNGKYQKITEEKHLDKNIHFLGHRNDIASLMQIADVAVASSIREGFGINLVEALCCDVPVIATNNRGHRDIVIDGENGYLTSYDKKEFQEKVLQIYSHEATFHPRETANRFLLNESISVMRRVYFGENKA